MGRHSFLSALPETRSGRAYYYNHAHKEPLRVLPGGTLQKSFREPFILGSNSASRPREPSLGGSSSTKRASTRSGEGLSSAPRALEPFSAGISSAPSALEPSSEGSPLKGFSAQSLRH